MRTLVVSALLLLAIGPAGALARASQSQTPPPTTPQALPNTDATSSAEATPAERLLQAAMSGRTADIQSALGAGADIKTTTASGATALALAAVQTCRGGHRHLAAGRHQQRG
jgi:hypothetical protein